MDNPRFFPSFLWKVGAISRYSSLSIDLEHFFSNDEKCLFKD